RPQSPSRRPRSGVDQDPPLQWPRGLGSRARRGKTLMFSPATFKFLRELEANNRREWFNANKERYLRDARDPMLEFIAAFAPRLRKISARFVADPSPSGGSMFRIYRDTRFSKDKSPYKTHVAAHFQHASSGEEMMAPGFYVSLAPGECFMGAGLW